MPLTQNMALACVASSLTCPPPFFFQDLLSFELLDINIVQELERVPHNTPVGKNVTWSTLFINRPSSIAPLTLVVTVSF